MWACPPKAIAVSCANPAAALLLPSCRQAETPWWIMGIAGGFVMLGCTTVGYRVISTIGDRVRHG